MYVKAPQDLSEARLRSAVAKSMALLGVSYLDLYLIHWPGAQGVPANSPDNARFRIEAWKAMIQLHDRGRGVLRAIGVSNFTPKHLEQIIKATGVAPAVNQASFYHNNNINLLNSFTFNSLIRNNHFKQYIVIL